MDLVLLLENGTTMNSVLKEMRSFQVHEMNKGRSVYGEYHHLFPLLKSYGEEFNQYLRMNMKTFNYILNKTTESLSRNWCNFHTQPILPEEQLVLVLRFLATGASYSDLSFSFRMGISTVSTVIKKGLQIIWKDLYQIHMPIPTEEKFLCVSNDFFEEWGFPHCLGAIDGRHVRIKKPPHSGSLFYNYKKIFSIVLQAVVDANYKFLIIDVGSCGSQNDAATFHRSNLYKALFQNKLKIPRENVIEGSHLILPYYFVGDGAYPLMKHLMKPYPGKDLHYSQILYNKKLSSARAVVENSFGFMCQKWRIFYTTIDKPLYIVKSIIKCACLLHNVIIDLEKNDSLELAHNRNASTSNRLVPYLHIDNNFVVGAAKEVQDELRKHFISERQ